MLLINRSPAGHELKRQYICVGPLLRLSFHSEFQDPLDKRTLGIGIGFPVEAMLFRKLFLELGILGCDLRMRAHVVTERQSLDPKFALEGHEVKMVGAERG